MKLLTHNMLTSNILKGVTKGYPLGIIATSVERKTVDFNPEFIARMLPKIDWPALLKAAQEVGFGEGLPEEIVADYETNEDFLNQAHTVMMEVEITTGELVCPESGRKFPITNGIPNMTLHEDEV